MSTERLLLSLPATVISCLNPDCYMEFVLFSLVGAVLHDQEWAGFCPYCGQERQRSEPPTDDH